MDAERWQRVKFVFFSLLDVEPPDARAAQMAVLCEGDVELESELRSLLAWADSEPLLPIARPDRVPRRPQREMG